MELNMETQDLPRRKGGETLSKAAQYENSGVFSIVGWLFDSLLPILSWHRESVLEIRPVPTARIPPAAGLRGKQYG